MGIVDDGELVELFFDLLFGQLEFVVLGVCFGDDDFKVIFFIFSCGDIFGVDLMMIFLFDVVE